MNKVPSSGWSPHQPGSGAGSSSLFPGADLALPLPCVQDEVFGHVTGQGGFLFRYVAALTSAGRAAATPPSQGWALPPPPTHTHIPYLLVDYRQVSVGSTPPRTLNDCAMSVVDSRYETHRNTAVTAFFV